MKEADNSENMSQEAISAPATSPDVTNNKSGAESHQEDASTKEIAIYAFGNIENASANQFFIILQEIMVVAMSINPLLIGFALSIKTLWDSITDPIMAYITDNTKSRWGRRHPYILIGGVVRIAMLLFVISLFPISQMRTNKELDTQRQDEAIIGATQKILDTLASEESEGTKVSEILTQTKEILKNQKDNEKLKSKIAEIEKLVLSIPANPTVKDSVKNEIEALLRIFNENKILHLAEIQSRDISFAAGARYASAERISEEQEIAFMKSIEKELHTILSSEQYKDIVLFMAKPEDFIESRNIAKNAVSEMLDKKEMEPSKVAEKIVASISAHLARTKARAETRKKLEAIYQNVYKVKTDGGNIKEALEKSSQISDELQLLVSQWQASPEFLQKVQEITRAVKEGGTSADNIINNTKQALEIMNPKKGQTVFSSLIDGIKAFSDPDNAHQRKVVLYFLMVCLIFTTFTTMNSVPYYALGIELCSSYDGRTKVVVWRSIMDQLAGLIGPWMPVVCFSLIFVNALQGLWWVALFTACIGIPSTIIMVLYTKERGHTSMQKKKGMLQMGFWKSIWVTLQNEHFVKIVLLYCSVGLAIGLFAQLGFFLNVYWVMKSAVGGAKLIAWVSMVAWGLGFLTLPVINWGCKRFQKHTMMATAMFIMAVGCILKWWCINPKYPYLQLILPFFFSIGIASTYTVLATMMSDVTDVDELRTGQRREGMFGAVNAFILKMVGAITPAIAGAIVVLSGFDPDLGFEQKASTILNMRLMYSFVPGILTIFCMLLLYRYPLTREKIAEIKKELQARRTETATATK